MQYFISFLEGIITFVSPCLLPMLPVYLSYFAQGGEDRRRTMANAAAFVLGFGTVFVALGAFAGTLGNLLREYKTAVNIVTGAVVFVLGVNFTGFFRIGLLNRSVKMNLHLPQKGFFTTFLFGIVFSIGWTPCVGAFLGSALMLASQEGSAVQGILMLVTYSVGLGLPFLASALLIDRLKETFQWIKKHYRIINLVSGIFLMLVGVMMMTGTMGVLLAWLS